MSDSGRRAAFPLGPDLACVAPVRHLVRALVEAWGWAEVADVVEDLLSELASNAIRHTSGPGEVLVAERGDALRVAVSDNLPRKVAPVLPDIDGDEPHGWGLALVECRSDRWDCEIYEWGKAVWFEIRQPAV